MDGEKGARTYIGVGTLHDEITLPDTGVLFDVSSLVTGVWVANWLDVAEAVGVCVHVGNGSGTCDQDNEKC